MFEAMFLGGLLRVIQALAAAAPTILIGLLVAATLRRLFGHAATRRMFGAGTWRELPQAWLIGMLLPVCSLGAIPVAREMRRAGISGGTILAFAMTAPLFNPLSLLYGLTLSNPVVLLAFSLCSLLIVTVVGAAWDWFFPGTAKAEDPPPRPVAPGLSRMAALLLYMVRQLAGSSLGYLAIALLGVVLLNVVLPVGAMQTVVEQDNPWAPLIMTAVAIPAYATPMTAMGQLGMMFNHGNSIGAAFALLVFGAGLNLGLLAWMARTYGGRRSAAWMLILLAVVIGLAYGVDRPLRPHDVEPAGHTHAFDIYCCPFHHQGQDCWQKFNSTLSEEITREQRWGLALLGTMLAIGVVLQIFDPQQRLERWLETPRRIGRFDWYLPGPVLGGIWLAILIGLSIGGSFVYYPAPDQCFLAMEFHKAETVSGGLGFRRHETDRGIPLLDDWTRRLQVGVYLRQGRVSDYQRMKARVFLNKLELLEHAMDDPLHRQEAAQLALAVDLAHIRMKRAFGVGPQAPE